MKYLVILMFLFVLPLFGQSYSPEVTEIQPTEESATWAYRISIDAGKTVDLVQFSKAGFNNAWLHVESGQIEFDGQHPNYVSWSSNSTVVVRAIEATVIVVQGN